MCVAVPVEVTEIVDEKSVRVGHGEISFVVSSMLMEEPKLGDWVLVHAGFVIKTMDKKEAEESLKLFTEYYREKGDKND